MLTKLLMLSILSTAILSICSEGCLRCDLQNDRCQFCDVKKGFKTVRGECMKVYSENCAIFNFEGFCIHCEKGYFLDTFAMRCVPVPEIGLVQNCDTYSSDNVCHKCSSGFHLMHNNTCAEVTTPIDKCTVYRSPELCEQCQIGYLLALNFKSCEQPSQISNCNAYSKIQCQQCKSGYKKNQNNYLRMLYSFNNTRGLRQLEHKLVQQAQEKMLPAYDTCQKLDIDNCLVYSTPNECAQCMPNYFLQQNRCIVYPQERILNCLRYRSLSECVECEEGMHLKTEQECVLNDKVDNCITYDACAFQTTCAQCAPTHYLSEFNICTQRTSASDIANCVQLSKSSETCDQCVESFTLTSDRKKCLQQVPNCLQYEDSDSNTLQLVCRVCDEGFYYDQESQTCKEGTISKCVRYSRVSNSCEECENRYYLAGGLCRTHEDLVFCDTYSNNKKNSCSVCNDKTVLLFRLNTCLPVTYIKNCKVYETQESCQVCEDGYELTNNQHCRQIPGSEFCLQKQDNECVKCLQSYVLQDGTCELPLQHITRNCASYNVNGLLNYSQLKCNYCKENTIPMNYKDSFTCYEKRYLENQLDITVNDDCLKYKQVNGVYQCVSCKKGHLLLDGECIAGPFCPPTHTLRLQVIQQLDVDSNGEFDSFYVEKVNECGPKINNCKVATPDLLQNQTNVRYSCVTCDDGMVAVVEYSDRKVLMRTPRFEDDDMFSPLNHTSSKICKDPSNENMIGRIEDDGRVKGCELYQNLTGFGLGCQKCKHGLTGRVYDVIHRCLKYSSLTTCTQCQEGYYPKESYQCVRVEPTLHCEKYDSSDSLSKGKCKQCEKEFYVDLNNDNKCERRNQFVDHCEKYNSDNQKCKECKQGHFLMNEQCHKKIYKCERYVDEQTCEVCEDGHYIMNNLCYAGKVQNCNVYDQGPNKVNVCKVCENKFYLKNNQCKPFAADIVDCDVYSQENSYCNKCKNGQLLFFMKKQCKAVKTIAQCKEYGSRESCRLCNDGYYPVNYGLRCLQIPASKNCSKWGPLTKGANYDEDNCLKCQSDQFLLINKQCRQWFKAIRQNCEQSVEVMDGTQSFYKCKYCQANMTPMSVQNEGLCLEQEMFESFPAVQSIQKCTRYTMETGELKCLQCESDYYVLNQTQCVTLQQCVANSGYYPTKLVVDTTANDNSDITQGASCINSGSKFSDVKNCLYQPVISGSFLGGSGEFKYGCVQCFAGYVPFIDILNTSKRLAYALDGNINSTVPVYDDCLKPADMTLQGTPNSNNEIENCAVYSKYSGDTNHFCLACKTSYRGQVKPGQIPSDVNNFSSLYSYIDTCVSFTGCASNTIAAQSLIPSAQQYLHASYLNVFDMGVLFSGCNKCDTASEYLVAFVNIDTTDASVNYTKITGLAAVKITGGTIAKESVVADANGHSFGCYAKNGSSQIVIEDKNFPEIANCQKYIVNANALTTNGITFGTTTTLDYACVQCEPKYKASRPFDGDATHTGQEIINTCTLIPNCASSTQPNICEVCDSNYAFKYDTTANEVRLDECILTNKTNCYSASATECKICKSGYLLDANTGDCVLQKPPKCDVYNPHATTPLTKKFVRYSMKLMQNAAGCVKCETGYIPVQHANNYLQAIQLEEVKKVCVNSTTVDTIAETIDQCDTANLRKNLRSEYEGAQQLRVDCLSCQAGFIETQDGKCISESNNPNCLLVESATNNYCVQCAATYLSIAGVCKTNATLDNNCDQFADMSFRTGALCKKCKNGYYLVTEVIDSIVTTTCQLYNDTKIANCAQFDSTDLSRLFCVECNTDYALMILNGDEVNGKEGYNRLCLSVSGKVQTNCAEFSVSAQSNGQFVCERCQDNFMLEDIEENKNVCVDTLSTVQNCAKVDINDQLEHQYQGVIFKNNYFPRLSSLKCTLCDEGYFLQTNTNSCAQRTRTNAQTYNNQCNNFEPLDDFCKVCNENYFLSGDKTQCVPAPVMTHSEGSLFSCMTMPECKKDVYRNGLDSHIDSLLSCHECKKSAEIPFIAISGEMPYNKITGLNQYDLVQGENNFTNLVGGKSNFCTNPIAANFNIDNTNNDKFAFPQNCAVGVLNVDTAATLDASHAASTTNVDRNKIQVFCAACKPGYKFVPAVDANNVTVPYMAGECQLIQNCKYSTAFNNCTECKQGFAFAYVNNEVKYDTCVQVTNNEDCYAKDEAASKCKFCCKGTYLNKDGLCERIQPPKCRYNQYIAKQIYQFNDLNTGLYLSSKGTGCNECEEGFYGLFNAQNNWICTESEAHYQNLLTQQTEYISNCVNYFQENEALKCKKCKDGFVPIQQDGRCTAVNTGLQNCVLALSDVHCEICEDDYVLVNRACQKKNIDKCYQYTYNIESHQQVCIDCEAGYYLDANTCLPGNVKNCLLYETNTVCNKCNPGFHLVKRNDGVSYCYPIDQRLNCAKFDSNEFQKGRLQCNECVNNQFVISTDYGLYYSTHCLKFFETPNCVKYDIKPAIADSSFSCQECTSNFYLNELECEVRTVQPMNCVEYSKDQDVCSQCSDGFFVSEDGTECLAYPVGTPNCRLYTDAETCVSCAGNYYLQNGLCVLIGEEFLVENCLYQVGPNLCDQCQDGFLNIDGKCQKIQAQNCKEVESLLACASCPRGYGFVEENSIKSCVQQSIQNCVDFDPNPDYKCLQCEAKFYVNAEGACVAVETEIDHCLVYQEEGVCKRCESFTVLSLDRSECLINRLVVEQIDQNCEESLVVENYQCRSCDDGYVFVEEKCQKCELQDNEFCQVCDPLNLNQCLLCKSGYFMNKDGICEEFVPPKPANDDWLNPPVDDNTDVPTDSENSTLKLTTFVVMMVVVNLLF